MAIEFELKFRATAQILTALQAAVPGTTREIRMQTTYYDTPTGTLSAQHYTLRQRMENDSSVCTFKCPISNNSRKEFEVSCDTIEAAIPELCKLSNNPALSALTKEGVVAVCGAKFTRITKTFTWSGTLMELALDSGVLTGGGKELPLCEVELELKEGSRETVCIYADKLAAAYNLVPEAQSKFRRALALAKGE